MGSEKCNTYLVTGGAGFIGSAFVLSTCARREAIVVNLDRLTYAANPMNLASVEGDSHYIFVHGDIADRQKVRSLFCEYKPCAVVNFAAESHVDRSIDGPGDFISTNLVGTFHLLEEARRYWGQLPPDARQAFRFLHVSTDEVYGSLGPEDHPFTEKTPYSPNSPYSASKAGSDHLVRAYNHTYGLPTLITNCSNNYGPRQFPEKLIPLVTLNALKGKPLPVYGKGENVRDWLHVDDHCNALHLVLQSGRPGETYNIGGRCESTNLEVVRAICRILDVLWPDSPHVPHESLISFVKDRLGHDLRYAVDCSKIENELGWRLQNSFESGLASTVAWYLENREWVRAVETKAYREWVTHHYGQGGAAGEVLLMGAGQCSGQER